MKILVLNCGSSSLKFALFNSEKQEQLVGGQVENIGTDHGLLKAEMGSEKHTKQFGKVDHEIAIEEIRSYLESTGLVADGIDGVGHRVVHGGEHFTGSILIDDKVMEAIRDCNHLAPLHNPVNLTGIEFSQKYYPGVPQVAVFDTSFHQTLEPKAYLYPVPYELYEEHSVRRYGFHGTSHRFVVAKAAELLNKKVEDLNVITAHLGNGCSAAAIKGGKSVDTTMGLTPLEGLMMGTRSGSVDPGLHSFLHESLGWDIAKINTVLNKKSGLLGISGKSQDMRTLAEAAEAGDEKATLAIEIFIYRLAKSLASLVPALGSLDLLIFTGGIGENNRHLRKEVIKALKFLGMEMSDQRNSENGEASNGIISTDESSTLAMVVPTNEELLIALDTEQAILEGAK
jgi:acetate kinase